MSDPVILLEMLLRENAGKADVEHARRWLESQGIRVTGVGVRSMSARADADAFRRLFGEPRPTRGGFAPDLSQAHALPVPEPLERVVEMLTLTPPHQKL
jgi:hypothetical protein